MTGRFDNRRIDSRAKHVLAIVFVFALVAASGLSLLGQVSASQVGGSDKVPGKSNKNKPSGGGKKNKQGKGNANKPPLPDQNEKNNAPLLPPTLKYGVLGTCAGNIQSVAFSSDGRRIASGSTDSLVRIWDGVTGEARVLGRCDGAVQSVAFSPDGKSVASGGSDKTIRVWNVQTGQMRVIGVLNERVLTVSFSPDGRSLVVGGSDMTIRLFDVQSGSGRVLGTVDGNIFSVAFSPDGRSLVSGEGRRVPVEGNGVSGLRRGKDNSRQFSFETSPAVAQTKPKPKPPADNIQRQTERPPAQRFETEGIIRVWHAASGKTLLLSRFKGYVYSVAFSPDGRNIAAATNPSSVILMDAQTGKKLWEGTQPALVRSVVYSPDGRSLVTGSVDGSVRLWDTATGQARVIGWAGEPVGAATSSDFVYSVAFSPDGKSVVSGEGKRRFRKEDPPEGAVRLWNLKVAATTER
jgi:WD40 repeat protein